MGTLSPFILVEWKNEGKFSVVHRDKIFEPSIRVMDDESLASQEDVQVFWGKRVFLATIITCGIKLEMEHELNVLTEEAKQKRASGDDSEPTASKLAKITKATLNNAQIDDVLNKLDEANDEIESENRINYKQLWELEKQRADKFKRKIKTLKTKLQAYEDNVSHEVNVELAPGVKISKGQLDGIKTMSVTATHFARHLMRVVFQEEELIGKSLYGRPCNANKDKLAKPAVNAEKRDSIIILALKEFGGEQISEASGLKRCRNPLLIQIHRSMGDMIREVNAKIKDKAE